MNKSEFEELEFQVQQSGLPLKSHLRQIGVSYSTYHYWRKKCLVDKGSHEQEFAPISFKQPTSELALSTYSMTSSKASTTDITAKQQFLPVSYQ